MSIDNKPPDSCRPNACFGLHKLFFLLHFLLSTFDFFYAVNYNNDSLHPNMMVMKQKKHFAINTRQAVASEKTTFDADCTITRLCLF